MKYNIEATVFVYRHLETGKVRALYMDDAHAMTGRDDYEHIATLEPRAWIEAHYDDAEMKRWVDDRARYAASECAAVIRARGQS